MPKHSENKVSPFLRTYSIFLLIMLILAGIFLVYVTLVVNEYDRTQPERCLDAEIDKIRACMEKGGIDEYFDLKNIHSKYDTRDEQEYADEYTALINGAQKLSYTQDALSSKGLEKAYLLTADGKPFASVKLTGSNERSKLFFFSMADWSVESVVPCSSSGNKPLTLLVPDGITCLINGIELDEPSAGEVGGVPSYTVSDLPDNVTLAFSDPDGKQIGYYTDNGTVIPAVYNHSLSLPYGITVTVDGKLIDGTPDGNGGYNYQIQSISSPDVKLTDIFGNGISYDSSDIPLKKYTVMLPDNYTLSAGGQVIPADEMPHTPDSDAVELCKYVSGITLHDIVTYQVSTFGTDCTVSVTDNLNNTKEYQLAADHVLSIVGQRGTDDVPDEILSQIDPMKFAVDWSLFMTNDQKLDNVLKYFLKDSLYYEAAYSWAHSIDHKFTSSHYTPEISKKTMRDYIRYSDDCFSVRVGLEKSMKLKSSGRTVVDTLDMIVYFVKYDATPDNGVDDPKWIVAVKHDA